MELADVGCKSIKINYLVGIQTSVLPLIFQGFPVHLNVAELLAQI